ncbi:MAG: hypothetical protein ABI551_22200, partial [Polyangiaceae bacterium]
MTASKIRSALGVLQDDPESERAWRDLADELRQIEAVELVPMMTLLEAARRAHEGKHEYDAVARMLKVEIGLAKESPDREGLLTAELARVYDEETLDDAEATKAFERLLVLRPGDLTAEEALEKGVAKREKWAELVARYEEESGKSGEEAAFKSSLLVSAAETAYRYGRPALQSKEGKKNKKKLEQLNDEMIDRLQRALAIDPKNKRAVLLLERLYRQGGHFEALSAMLEEHAIETAAKDERVATLLRLARVYKRDLKSDEGAVRAYEAVTDLQPGNSTATSALVDYFTSKEDWDHLIALYDEQLATGVARGPSEVGV